MGLTREKKEEYFEHMKNLIDTYQKIFVVHCDNVGSRQFMQIRCSLRGRGVVLMGKNTMMRKIVAEYLDEHPGHPIEAMVPLLRGNVGFVFTNDDLGEIRDVLLSNTKPAPAKIGSLAPVDVVVPAGPTDCDPGQTAFFQTLEVSTKIVKGRIEIISPVQILTAGDKVSAGAAALLTKLDICPFVYGLTLVKVYDNGSLFAPSVLDITDEILAAKFGNAVRNIAALGLALGMPNTASIPHSLRSAFSTLVSIAVECEGVSFTKAEPFIAKLPAAPAAEPAAEE